MTKTFINTKTADKFYIAAQVASFKSRVSGEDISDEDIISELKSLSLDSGDESVSIVREYLD